MKDKIIIQFKDKKYIGEGDEEEYYRIVGIVALRALDDQTHISTKVIVATGVVDTKIPSRYELETFIKSQPDYEYTIEAITDHFVDRSNLNKEEFSNWDRALRIKVKRIAETIAKSEKGQWEGKHIGGHKKVFKFVRSE